MSRNACASLLCLVLVSPLAARAEAPTPPSGAEAEAEWEAGDADTGPGYRYQVFSQEAPGEDFVRYQVRGQIRASPAELRRSVRIVASNPDHAPRGHTRRVVESTPGAFVIHTNIDLPLLADRDIVTLGTSSIDETQGIHRIRWSAIADERIPEVPGVVRIEKAAGFWEFVPNGDGTTQVTYETYIDLGGSIPMWIVDTMMPSMVSGNFEDLAEVAQRRTASVAAPPPVP